MNLRDQIHTDIEKMLATQTPWAGIACMVERRYGIRSSAAEISAKHQAYRDARAELARVEKERTARRWGRDD